MLRNFLHNQAVYWTAKTWRFLLPMTAVVMLRNIEQKMDIEEIRKAAIDFRNAIEACVSSLGIAFESFPRGSCGDTVPMLGVYLRDLGLGDFQYMVGNYGSHEKGTWSSHGWLQSNNLVIDITADQFPEITEKVIVEKESRWHKKLNGEPQNLADYRIYDANTASNLGRMYQKIVECITNTKRGQVFNLDISVF